MRGLNRATVASGLLALATRASAQLAKIQQGDVAFQLNIPSNTASSGSGDIFFQISAPTSYEWVALGQGGSMANSNIFVVYTSADGKNVTLSPRHTSNYNMPTYSSDAQVTLLEGSGVSNGKMIANVRCSNCDKWSGGSMSFTANSGSWIYAFKSSGGPKNSNDQSAQINQHNSQSPFSWSWADAKGGNSVNPLLNSGATGTGGGSSATTSCVPRPTSGASAATGTTTAPTSTQTSDDTGNDDGTTRRGRPTSYSDFRSRYPVPTGASDNNKRQAINYCDDSSSSNTNNGFTPILSGAKTTFNKRLAAHGILASLAFVIFFPAGAIAIRLASFPFVVAFHGAFQVFAYLVYIAAFGLGVTMANDLQVLNSQHPIIGIVVFILIFLQPFFGFIHHAMFKKRQTRTITSHLHIWIGRIAIALGIINGGLGFKLADKMGMGSKSGKIAYAVLAAIFGVAWIAAIVIGERKRSKNATNAPPKYTDTPLTERNGSRGSDPTNEHYAPK